MNKFYLIAKMMAILFFIIIGCSEKKKSNDTKEVLSLNVGMIPITDCSQLFVAKEFGIFENNGLDVKLIPVSGGSQILQALAANEIDVAFSNLASIVFYENNFEKLKNLNGGTLMNEEFSEGGLVCLDNGVINSIKDFKNKIIAVNSLNNIVHLAVVKILKKHGISLQDVTIVEMKFSDMNLALRSNRIDIATLPEPLLTMSSGDGKLKNFGDYIVMAFGENYVTGYYTTTLNFDKNTALYQKFNKSMNESTDLLNTFNDSVVNAISKYTKVSDRLIKSSGKPLFVKGVPEEALIGMKNWLNEESFIK